ncbi:hypothetical protein ACFFLS_06210 [Flavobacterium procerum]|uniref:Uncharacterized protein n=1 Tax=Flavobacterium procerum TaxID=1455569 RepID=A0ABV6BMF0_9FLAO
MENIGTALVEVIKNEKLQDVTKELTELSIDSALKDGLLKDFPILGTLTGLIKVGGDIRDKLFLKKIWSFLSSLDSTTAEQRQKMINDIETSDEYNIKVGEKLLYIIDKCDDHHKSEIIGCLFNQYLKAKISYDEFLLCCSIVERCIIKDLIGFVKDKFGRNFSVDAELLNWGLLSITNIKDEKIGLSVSKGGKLIKNNLIPLIDKRIKKLQLRSKTFNELEDYFTKVFATFSTDSRWNESIQTISEATAELCNNYILTDEEFNSIIFKVHMQGYGLFNASSTYIEMLKKRENFSETEFDINRWKRYDSFYSWNKNKLKVEIYEVPDNLDKRKL